MSSSDKETLTSDVVTTQDTTPILTGTLQPTPDGGYAPAMRARREFPAAGQLYCGFDVFSAAKGPDGLPRVVAGYELRRGATVVGRAQPNPIRPTSIGACAMPTACCSICSSCAARSC